jgi:hypothetical protein
VANESSLPIPDLAAEILLDRFGLDAEFALLCSTLAVVNGRAPGLLMPSTVPFIVLSSPNALLPDTARFLLTPALAIPLGVAGESVPIRDRLLPERGVMLALSGEMSSLAIEAMFGRVLRSGDVRNNAGEVWREPASLGVIGLLLALSLELRAGMRGLVGWPLLLCLWTDIVAVEEWWSVRAWTGRVAHSGATDGLQQFCISSLTACGGTIGEVVLC